MEIRISNLYKGGDCSVVLTVNLSYMASGSKEVEP